MIDAHQHYWTLARGDYDWLTPELGPLYRDFEPADLYPLLGDVGVTGTVLVQAAATAAETDFLLAIAEREKSVLGVVGWLDPADENVAESVATLAERAGRRLVGLRAMLQGLALCGEIDRPARDPYFAALGDRDLAFDALVTVDQLAALERRARRSPELRIVLDHAGKPGPTSDFERWKADMAMLGACPNVVVKLSGLVTEIGEGWLMEDVRKVFSVLLEKFGPVRMMWGSDWPVVTLAGGYGRWVEACRSLAASLDASGRDALFTGTARRVYRLEDRA